MDAAPRGKPTMYLNQLIMDFASQNPTQADLRISFYALSHSYLDSGYIGLSSLCLHIDLPYWHNTH